MIFRKLISYVLIIFLVVTNSLSMYLPKTASANSARAVDLVSLGDSIAYGLSAPAGQGYSDLFYNYLQSKPELTGIKLYNLAKPGLESSDLLNELKSDSKVKGNLEKANIVTISIGGNNLLGPVIRSVAAAYHLDLSDPQLNVNLGTALQSDKNLSNTLLGLAISGTLETELNKGVAKFQLDWPQIIDLIKTQVPKSQLYALTVYNPFPQNDLLFSLFDPYVQQINKVIKAGDGYLIADIYTYFQQRSSQLPFNYDLLKGQTDPHPTQQGHKMIFHILVNLFELHNASLLGSKMGIPANKVWTVKFNMPLEDSGEEFIKVYTATGLPINVTVKSEGLWSNSLVVLPPQNGYTSGVYSICIFSGVTSKSGQKLAQSVRMNFTVE
ncbi:MAG: GDSL-type esterase/lipase family protein [Bacillota bacterium]|nr:GDSL-type esterase/lipase family protein [Bacillota bacterium]